MDLYNLSQERGVGKMFEHGVVGALTNTFDSAALGNLLGQMRITH